MSALVDQENFEIIDELIDEIIKLVIKNYENKQEELPFMNEEVEVINTSKSI